jgi:hypothetical protein
VHQEFQQAQAPPLIELFFLLSDNNNTLTQTRGFHAGVPLFYHYLNSSARLSYTVIFIDDSSGQFLSKHHSANAKCH